MSDSRTLRALMTLSPWEMGPVFRVKKPKQKSGINLFYDACGSTFTLFFQEK